jgi:hypothetical protein
VRVAFVQKRYQEPSWYCVLVPLHAESPGASGGTVPKEINRWFAGPPCHVHHSSIVTAAKLLTTPEGSTAWSPPASVRVPVPGSVLLASPWALPTASAIVVLLPPKP